MTQDVFRRRVFYIPGFDPFPPRRYRELYRTESQEQARISDYTIAQEPLRNADTFGWRVTSTIEGRDTVSDITVLTWSDLVKSSMDRGGVVDLSVAVQNCVDLYCLGCVARRDEVAQGSRDCRALSRRVFDCATGFCDFVRCAPILSPLANASRVGHCQLGDHLAHPCAVSEI